MLAGDDAKSVAPAGEPQPANGFETTLNADTNADFIAVRALDRDGKVLGTSAAVAISGGLNTG